MPIASECTFLTLQVCNMSGVTNVAWICLAYLNLSIVFLAASSFCNAVIFVWQENNPWQHHLTSFYPGREKFLVTLWHLHFSMILDVSNAWARCGVHIMSATTISWFSWFAKAMFNMQIESTCVSPINIIPTDAHPCWKKVNTRKIDLFYVTRWWNYNWDTYRCESGIRIR